MNVPNLGVNDLPPVKPKKKGNKKQEPVEPCYEGFFLDRAKPLPGEKLSWSRVVKTPLPFSHAKLASITENHRRRSGQGPAADFAQLSTTQQQLINRIIEGMNQAEKNPNADWILVDVQKDGEWHWTTLEIKRIQIIIKRYDKSAKSDGRNAADAGASKSNIYGADIIDLTQPLEKPTKVKDKVNDTDVAVFNEPMHDVPSGEFLPQTHQLQNQHIDYIDDHNTFGRDPLHQDPGGPMNHIHQPYPAISHPLGQSPPLIPPAISPLYDPPHRNPFQPEPHVLPQGSSYDSPRMPEPNTQGYALQRDYSRNRSPARQQSVERSPPPVKRRPSTSKKIERLEDEVSQLRDQLENVRMNGHSRHSSVDQRDNPGMWSPSMSGYSYSPPSSPPLSEVLGPRGSLHNAPRSPRGRMHRYKTYQNNGQADIQPAVSHPRGRRDTIHYHHVLRHDDNPHALDAQHVIIDYDAEPNDYPKTDLRFQELRGRRQLTAYPEDSFEIPWRQPARKSSMKQKEPVRGRWAMAGDAEGRYHR